MSKIRGGFACGPSTLWRFEVAMLAFLLLWLVRDWLQLLLCRVCGECGHSACSCRSGVVGTGLAGSGLPCVEDTCREVQVQCSWSSSAHLSVCALRRLRELACGVAFTSAELLSVESSALLLELSRCSVCHVASLVECCDTCLWLLSAWCWLVVSSSEAEVHHLVALCSGEVSQNRLVLSCGMVVLVGFSQDRLAFLLLAAVFSLMVHAVWSFGLCVLVKVLPRICVVWLGYVLVRFSQGGSWRFWWRVVMLHCGVVLPGVRIVATFWWSHLPLSCFWVELVAPLGLSFPYGIVGWWTCLQFLACGFWRVSGEESFCVLVSCRLEPECIALYLGWLPVLVIAPCVVSGACS
ncbi:hypothetical protein Taro_022008 [Colocasia esculenta]|uniref:Uncharacterized protein n=1 Tax=Colocasia esculenta TaxID=4460 RepID=A0A843V2R5_COLES|nr:hypothetical protein [Colocasia esculenta]